MTDQMFRELEQYVLRLEARVRQLEADVHPTPTEGEDDQPALF